MQIASRMKQIWIIDTFGMITCGVATIIHVLTSSTTWFIFDGIILVLVALLIFPSLASACLRPMGFKKNQKIRRQFFKWIALINTPILGFFCLLIFSFDILFRLNDVGFGWGSMFFALFTIFWLTIFSWLFKGWRSYHSNLWTETILGQEGEKTP